MNTVGGNACTLCHRSSPETVELDADLLRQEVKFVGGSCAGIFVDELGKATDSNLNVGDKIIKVRSHRVMPFGSTSLHPGSLLSTHSVSLNFVRNWSQTFPFQQ